MGEEAWSGGGVDLGWHGEPSSVRVGWKLTHELI